MPENPQRQQYARWSQQAMQRVTDMVNHAEAHPSSKTNPVVQQIIVGLLDSGIKLCETVKTMLAVGNPPNLDQNLKVCDDWIKEANHKKANYQAQAAVRAVDRPAEIKVVPEPQQIVDDEDDDW